jgi:hypothetical protein
MRTKVSVTLLGYLLSSVRDNFFRKLQLITARALRSSRFERRALDLHDLYLQFDTMKNAGALTPQEIDEVTRFQVDKVTGGHRSRAALRIDDAYSPLYPNRVR